MIWKLAIVCKTTHIRKGARKEGRHRDSCGNRENGNVGTLARQGVQLVVFGA